MLPYALLYKLGFAPWERRDVADTWRHLLDGTDPPGDRSRARRRLRLGPRRRLSRQARVDRHRGRLGRQGARYRSAAGSRRGRRGAVGQGPCGGAGLARPRTGYNLVYDFGCIHGLSDAARTGAAAGLTHLAAPGATLLMVAFKAGRGIVLPRGMNKEDVVALLRDGWDLEESRSVVTEDMPAFLRRANPTVYRLTRRTAPA